MAEQDIPVLGRQTEAQVTSEPDVQSGFDQLAASQNNLSAIGAQVAQSASNQTTAVLGNISCNNPHVDLTPPLTDFDKNFTQNYQAQAQATLGLQGQKLLDDAHVAMSKPPRLTPELIAQTQNQLQSGLSKIADQAPTAIKGSLQNTFNSQILDQTMQYQTKMIQDN